MAILVIPEKNQTITEVTAIQSFLNSRGVFYEVWQTPVKLAKNATQDEILGAYRYQLEPFMKKGGYQVADVINVNPDTPNLLAIRQKFLKEHTHQEDEVRFFVEGQGLFWFNNDKEVFSVLCQPGDFISVPKNHKHWFDLGPTAHVKAIRIFIDPAGWVPYYTNSSIDVRFNPVYSE